MRKFAARKPISYMDYPPPEWDLFPAENFELAGPRDPGDLGVEVMAQAQNNGRLLDHFRVTLGGSTMLEAQFKLKTLMNHERLPNWELSYQLWPRDIKIRRNMTSTDWVDVRDLVSSRDVSIRDLDSGSEVEHAEYLAALDALGSAKTKVSCALRWGVCAGPDQKAYLHLQGLPAAYETFSGKLIMKG